MKIESSFTVFQALKNNVAFIELRIYQIKEKIDNMA